MLFIPQCECVCVALSIQFTLILHELWFLVKPTVALERSALVDNAVSPKNWGGDVCLEFWRF